MSQRSDKLFIFAVGTDGNPDKIAQPPSGHFPDNNPFAQQFLVYRFALRPDIDQNEIRRARDKKKTQRFKFAA
jgi:hypothetical protein